MLRVVARLHSGKLNQALQSWIAVLGEIKLLRRACTGFAQTALVAAMNTWCVFALERDHFAITSYHFAITCYHFAITCYHFAITFASVSLASYHFVLSLFSHFG